MKDIFPFLCILWTAMTSSGMGTNAPPFTCCASKYHKHCWRFAHTPVTYPAHPFLLANKISILFHRECAHLQEMNQISLNSSCTLSFAVPGMGGRPSAGLWNVKRSEEEAWRSWGRGGFFLPQKRETRRDCHSLFPPAMRTCKFQGPRDSLPSRFENRFSQGLYLELWKGSPKRWAKTDH